jgi:hypothetical protein
MTSPERNGFLWNFHGFTKLHLWGCYTVGGIFGAAGTALLVFAALSWNHLSNGIFMRLVLLAIGCFTCATSIAAAGIFTLVYFWGRESLVTQAALLAEVRVPPADREPIPPS